MAVTRAKRMVYKSLSRLDDIWENRDEPPECDVVLTRWRSHTNMMLRHSSCRTPENNMCTMKQIQPILCRSVSEEYLGTEVGCDVLIYVLLLSISS